LDEGKQAVCRDISDLLKADAAKPPAVLLDCYGDDGLAADEFARLSERRAGVEQLQRRRLIMLKARP
jgi:hypothetical protein